MSLNRNDNMASEFAMEKSCRSSGRHLSTESCYQYTCTFHRVSLLLRNDLLLVVFDHRQLSNLPYVNNCIAEFGYNMSSVSDASTL